MFGSSSHLGGGPESFHTTLVSARNTSSNVSFSTAELPSPSIKSLDATHPGGGLNATATATDNVIAIIPGRLFYGVVASGFYYNMTCKLQNRTLVPIRVRVTVLPGPAEKNVLRIVNIPDCIAPGCTASVTLELLAEFASASFFTFQVTQSYNSDIYRKMIEAHVVTPETFKYVKRSLQLQRRPIFRPNVKLMSAIPGGHGLSLTNVVTSSEAIPPPNSAFGETAIMDEDDLEDLFDLPTASNVYWDPFGKVLRIDPFLGRVQVDKDHGVEESIKRTNEKHSERLSELEDLGFFTPSVIKQLANGTRLLNATSSEDIRVPPSEPPAEVDESGLLTGRSMDTGSLTNSSRISSVSSLLAMKREKMENRRRATINAANAFQKLSQEDTMVNSMRTLNMIRSRSKML